MQKEHSDQEAEIKALASDTVRAHVRQRQRLLFREQYHHLLPQKYAAYVGAYYVYSSFALDDLLLNSHVPAWLNKKCCGDGYQHWGNVFVLKMSPQEHGPCGWAAYEDVPPEFLNIMAEGPSKSCVEDIGSRFWWKHSKDRPQVS
jgi:hypothetical protein